MSDETYGHQRVSRNVGGSDSVDWEILPGDFQFLRSGGPEHDNQVEGILYQAGRVWAASGKNYLHVTFNQNQHD
jgi:hypothetical protein